MRDCPRLFATDSFLLRKKRKTYLISPLQKKIKKLYTKKGDFGITKDYANNEIKKHDSMVKTVGKIDSLQSILDLAILKSQGEEKQMLEKVQKKLWQLSGELFNCPGDCLIDPVKEEDIQDMENFIDSLGEPPNKFVRFNTEDSITMNECRVRCRELETHLAELLEKNKLRPEMYQYINRLSSLFFMMGYKKSE